MAVNGTSSHSVF